MAPALKIGRFPTGAKSHVPLEAWRRLSRAMLSNPVDAVNEIVGKNAALATATRARAPRGWLGCAVCASPPRRGGGGGGGGVGGGEEGGGRTRGGQSLLE